MNMINIKTGSKKSLTTNKPQTPQTLKRFKSQEVYLVGSKKPTNTSSMMPTVSVNLNAPPLTRFSEKKEIKPITIESIRTTQKARVTNSSKSKQRTEKPLFAKILNDESIQELDTEENKLDDSNNLDEEITDIKCSQFNEQFYTNSIGEDCTSPKDKKLINNLPKPFVKQNVKATNVSTPEFNHEGIDGKHRKMLQAAKKGDRDLFLEIVEM
jgi:hypothetical protein